MGLTFLGEVVAHRMLADCCCDENGKGAGGMSQLCRGGFDSSKGHSLLLAGELVAVGACLSTGQDCMAEPAVAMFFPAAHQVLECTL